MKKVKVILMDFSFTLCFPNMNSLKGNFIINQELLNYLQTLKTKCQLYVFTAGSLHLNPKIMQHLKPIFNGYFTSYELKMQKSNPNTFKLLANKLNVDVSEILFVDDVQKNVDAAITAGASAIKFTSNALVIEEIKKSFS